MLLEAAEIRRALELASIMLCGRYVWTSGVVAALGNEGGSSG
jgi:hypothetical protein